MSQIEYEITMSPTTGVHVGFKVEPGASKKDVEAAATEAAGHLKAAHDAWEKWSDKNSTPRERKFRKMRLEQEDQALEQWQQMKRARAGAVERLRGV